MSSATANRESEGGTMKNVIDNPETQPQSHTYVENQPGSNMNQGNKGTGSHNQSHSNGNQESMPNTYHNQESSGGTMKNVIDNPETKPQSHTYAEDQSHSNTGQGNDKCTANGQNHKPGENNCNNCQKK